MEQHASHLNTPSRKKISKTDDLLSGLKLHVQAFAAESEQPNCSHGPFMGNRITFSSMTQSRAAKIEHDASPKYTEIKRESVNNSVTCRNSGKSERDEGCGRGGKSKSKKGRVTCDGIYERPRP